MTSATPTPLDDDPLSLPGTSAAGPCRRWRPLPVTDERRAGERVVDQLLHQFPHLPSVVVEVAVADAWKHLAEARVRDFVPVLAARAATAALTNHDAATDRVVNTPSGKDHP